MGTETIKLGVVRVFDMFQHKSLNKRFAYVFLEGVIVTLFPQNKFQDLFCKLHSRSERVTDLLKSKAQAQQMKEAMKRRKR